MTALGDARSAVAAALAQVGVPVHPHPPQTLNAPCVVIVPGSPWIQPRGTVTLDLVAYANPAGGNTPAVTRLEDLIEAIRDGLWNAGLAPGDTDQPRSDNDAGVLYCTTPVTLRTTCH